MTTTYYYRATLYTSFNTLVHTMQRVSLLSNQYIFGYHTWITIIYTLLLYMVDGFNNTLQVHYTPHR